MMFEHHDPYPGALDVTGDPTGAESQLDVVGDDVVGDDGTAHAFVGLELWPRDLGSLTNPLGSHVQDGVFEPEQPAVADPGQHDPEPAHAGPDIELAMPDGHRIDVGAPNLDSDGDGVAESVAVRAGDGHVLVVSDVDGDGAADHLTDVDENTGAVRWFSIGADGSWTVLHHGHVNPDGSMTVDHGLHGDHDARADGGGATGAEHAAPEQVSVSVDGQTFPAGPATIDSDHDGVPDTVAVPGVNGSTQYYQDTDGDGIADRAWTVNAHGTRSAEYSIDPGGQWVPTGVDPDRPPD